MAQRHIGKHVSKNGEVKANFHSNDDGTWWSGWTPSNIPLEEVFYSALTTTIDAIQQKPELLDNLLERPGWSDEYRARAEAAEAEVARLTDELAATLRALIGCDGDEGRDTSEYVTRWEAIMGDKWQGDE